MEDGFDNAASRTMDLTSQLDFQLEEERKRVEQLEVWVGSLTRELAAERQRCEGLLQRMLEQDHYIQDY